MNEFLVLLILLDLILNMAHLVIDLVQDLTMYNLQEIIGNTNEKCVQFCQTIGLIPYLNPSHFICPVNRNHRNMSKRIKRDFKIKYALVS